MRHQRPGFAVTVEICNFVGVLTTCDAKNLMFSLRALQLKCYSFIGFVKFPEMGLFTDLICVDKATES